MPVLYGYLAWCLGEDFMEPEGTVYFHKPPTKGDSVVLPSDGSTWIVKSVRDDTAEVVVIQPPVSEEGG